LPREFGRNKQTYDSIPDYVVKYPKLKIHWHPTDDGPLMKIINTIERVTDKDAICISIDDDILLGRYCINALISAQIMMQGSSCIGTQGSVVKNFLSTGRSSKEVKFFESLWPANKERVSPKDNL